MKYCSHCGAEIHDEAVVCVKCGCSVSKTFGKSPLAIILIFFIVVFIVTVAIITFNIMNKGGKPTTGTIDPLNPYIGKSSEYAMYTILGSVTTRTKDTDTNYLVTIDMIIGYDLYDNVTQTELVSRQYELRDFVRRYFTRKYATELTPEYEPKIKQDILETLNEQFLDKAKVRVILFNKLEVFEES